MARASKNQLLADVIAEITSAFAGVSLGDGVTLHQARAIDDYQSKEHQRAVRVNDTEQSWQEISDDKMCAFDDVFNFLDAKGWVFYIPAYMIWVLRHLDDQTDEHSGLNYMTVFAVTDRPRPELLNSRQRRAVCSFLHYLSENSDDWRQDADDALERYWGSHP